MTSENIYSKLTPSAKDALSELTLTYRNSVVEKAYRIAQEKNTANKEISLRDILEAQQPFEKSIRSQGDYQNYKRKRSTLLISFSGVIYASGGLLLYLYQNKKFSIDTDLGLIIAIIGITITAVFFLYGQLSSIRYLSSKKMLNEKDYSNVDNFEIVKRWQIIEQLTTSIMTSNNIGDSKSNSVNQVIRYLTENFTNSNEEYLSIRELLQVRNKILHEGYSLTGSENQRYIQIADNLIDKLEKANHPNR